MPRVKQTKMRLELNPAKPWEETVVYINYDNTSTRYDGEPEGGRFYVTLPAVMADALNQTEVKGKTQDEAFKAFQDSLERFKHLKTERNRVILYAINVSPHPKAEKNRYSSPVGYKVEIWAGTYEETVAIAGDGVRRYSYENVESSISFPGEDHAVSARSRREREKFEHQVPWTERNEVFFRWVADRMNELIIALAELEDPEKLIEAVITGILLPLGKQVVDS